VRIAERGAECAAPVLGSVRSWMRIEGRWVREARQGRAAAIPTPQHFARAQSPRASIRRRGPSQGDIGAEGQGWVRDVRGRNDYRCHERGAVERCEAARGLRSNRRSPGSRGVRGLWLCAVRRGAHPLCGAHHVSISSGGAMKRMVCPRSLRLRSSDGRPLRLGCSGDGGAALWPERRARQARGSTRTG
jgi:hypothetical protein